MRKSWLLRIFAFLLGLAIITSCTTTINQEDIPDVLVPTRTSTAVVEGVLTQEPGDDSGNDQGEGVDETPVCRNIGSGASMSYGEAVEIARSSICAAEGQLGESYFCNEGTGTWWIDLAVDKSGCAPACVVDVSTGAAEINWRCTGAIPEEQASPTALIEPHDKVVRSGQVREASFDAVSFTFNESLAAGVREEIFPEEPFLIVEGAIIPQHEEYLLQGYSLSDTFQKPKLWLYPVDEFAEGNFLAAEKIQQLGHLLAARPAEIGTVPFSNSIPIFPLFNAGQMMASQIEYLDFQNGSGVRFLTQLGQAYMPINNRSMFYTFQGITGNGRTYVAAIFPVSHPNLPPDGTMPEDAEAFTTNFDAYVVELEKGLDDQEEANFRPNLSQLDDLIRSLVVTKE